MKLEETNFYKERFSLGSSRLKVYYGIDKLNKIMTKPAVSIIFENDSQLLLEKRLKKINQRMHVVYWRYQTKGEAEDALKSSRIFHIYTLFFDKYKNDIEFLLSNNYSADENNVSKGERELIRELLRKKIYELYPQYKTGKGKPIQLTLNFE